MALFMLINIAKFQKSQTNPPNPASNIQIGFINVDKNMRRLLWDKTDNL